MMRQMRENTKWIMLATALAFVALMVFEWGMDISGRSAGSVGEIGRVNGTPVTYDQYMATYRNLYDQIQASQEEPITSQQNTEIEDAAWDEVVNQILVQQELARRGIRVTDDEVRQAARFSPPPEFRNNPAFQTEGSFDLQKYQQFISSPSIDEGLLLQLEAYYRDVIPRGKLLRQVSEGVYLSDAELWQAWKDQHEQVAVDYLALDPRQRIPDSEIQITDAEVEAYYEENEEEFEVPAQATVKVAFLPRAPTAADSAAALERAGEVRQRIVEGDESFTDVAAEVSADPGSAQQGGDLGTIQRGDLVAPMEEAVFAQPVGEIGEPIQTQFGIHLVEVTERWADSARARHVLVPVERTDESEITLLTRADSLEALGESRSLEDAAAELGLEVQTAEISADFPFVAGPGQVGEGADWAFEEAEPGDVSPVFENRQAFYALELVRSQPAGVLPLAQARPSIEETLRFEKKMERVREQATPWATAAREAGSLQPVAAEQGLEVREAGPFSRTDFVPGLGRQNAAVGTAFGLAEGEVSDVVTTEENAFILQLRERIPADSSAWVAQREDQRAQAINAIRQQRLQDWLAGLRENATIVDRRAEVLRPADEESDAPFGGIPPVF